MDNNLNSFHRNHYSTHYFLFVRVFDLIDVDDFFLIKRTQNFCVAYNGNIVVFTVNISEIRNFLNPSFGISNPGM